MDQLPEALLTLRVVNGVVVKEAGDLLLCLLIKIKQII
jgi:hypothetical protein